MQNMPESSSAYFVKNAEYAEWREEAVGEIMNLVWTMANRSLTPRQKSIFHLFFEGRRTQEEIAGMLDISQATVNHHLIGKIKQGKPVGGAIQKIRKSIRKASKDGGKDIRHSRLISVLQDMLEQPVTRRTISCHLNNLILLEISHP